MRLSIKGKQVAGVTSIVGLAVLVLSGLYLTSLLRITVEESAARAELLASAIFHRAREVVALSGGGPDALRADAGLRSILESSVYSRNVTYAALVNADGVIIAHSDTARTGQLLAPVSMLATLLDQGAIAQLRAIYGQEGRTFEVERPLLMDGVRFGSIRIGVSMPLTRRDLTEALKPAVLTAFLALVGATLVAMLLAQLLLRPILVIRTGLTRLGRGESGVAVHLPQHDEFGELGGFFNTVSAQLSADRSELVGQKAMLESVVNRLSAGVAHEIKNPLNATLIHLELLKQRLSVPVVAHVDGEPPGRAAGPDVAAALGHAAIIGAEMHRLDEVVQGFLKFARPGDLKMRAVSLGGLIERVVAVIAEDARERRVEIRIDCPDNLPELRGDPGMLQQAFLNLALNAVQAMPDGGRLRIAGAAVADSRVEVVFEDTGVGITPENLDKIFDLYFTTKGVGSGIGLSLVYRTIQLHSGEIEVHSTPGHGSVFRLLLPRAQAQPEGRPLGS